MEFFARIVNSFQLFTIFAKTSIKDFWHCSFWLRIWKEYVKKAFTLFCLKNYGEELLQSFKIYSALFQSIVKNNYLGKLSTENWRERNPVKYLRWSLLRE